MLYYNSIMDNREKNKPYFLRFSGCGSSFFKVY